MNDIILLRELIPLIDIRAIDVAFNRRNEKRYGVRAVINISRISFIFPHTQIRILQIHVRFKHAQLLNYFGIFNRHGTPQHFSVIRRRDGGDRGRCLHFAVSHELDNKAGRDKASSAISLVVRFSLPERLPDFSARRAQRNIPPLKKKL